MSTKIRSPFLAIFLVGALGLCATAHAQMTPDPMAPAPPAATVAKPMESSPAAMTAPAPMAEVPMAAKADAPAAMAAAPAKPTGNPDKKWSIVVGGVLEILLYVVGVLLAAILPVLTAWLMKKMKLENAQAKDAVDTIVTKAALFGLHYAEEQAHKMRDNPIDGADKMNTAVDAANKYLRDSGLPEKGAEYLATLIESKLGEKRAEKPNGVPEEKPAEKPADNG